MVYIEEERKKLSGMSEIVFYDESQDLSADTKVFAITRGDPLKWIQRKSAESVVNS
jgi:hypothetical protein